MSQRGLPRNRHPRGRGKNRNSPAPSSRNSSSISRSERSSNTPRRGSSIDSNPGPSNEHRFSRFGFQSSPSEMERWLENQVTFPATHLISYLSSPEGLSILSQIADSRFLSSKIVIKLTKLVTQDEIRSSLEMYDTNKIYGVFLGSAFLTQIQTYIGDMIEPRLEDLWPFIHLLDELQNRTTDGWKFLPVETIREAIDGIQEGAEKIELSEHFSKLLEYRNKLKRLQQLSKPKDCS